MPEKTIDPQPVIFKHLMVDIETMGNQSYSSIVSIAAVEFNIETAATGKEFYRIVSLQSCLDLGLIVNADTIMWWMQQSDEARLEFVKDEIVSIQQALTEFSKFCHVFYQVWANSPRFDLGIIQNAYNKAGIPIPWDFRKERCLRTLSNIKPSIRGNVKKQGISHNALFDCYNQIQYCCSIWNSLHYNNLEK
jgi:hypothetical protein